MRKVQHSRLPWPLSSLFVLATLSAVPPHTQSSPVSESVADCFVQRLGGKLIRLSEIEGPCAARIILDHTCATDSDVAKLVLMLNIRELFISNTPITDVGLRDILKLTKLTALDLEGTRVTNAGLGGLGRLRDCFKTAVELDG